jgi:hypothetical protein
MRFHCIPQCVLLLNFSGRRGARNQRQAYSGGSNSSIRARLIADKRGGPFEYRLRAYRKRKAWNEISAVFVAGCDTFTTGRDPSSKRIECKKSVGN